MLLAAERVPLYGKGMRGRLCAVPLGVAVLAGLVVPGCQVHCYETVHAGDVVVLSTVSQVPHLDEALRFVERNDDEDPQRRVACEGLGAEAMAPLRLEFSKLTTGRELCNTGIVLDVSGLEELGISHGTGSYPIEDNRFVRAHMGWSTDGPCARRITLHLLTERELKLDWPKNTAQPGSLLMELTEPAGEGCPESCWLEYDVVLERE